MSQSQSPITNAHLLVVDDIEEMRNIIRRLLEAMGLGKVTVARNGQDAWNLMQNLSFDLVLCDWNMPKMSGRDLLDKVRAEPTLAHIPFIMITGENTKDSVKSAIAGGVSDFLVKPFPATLLEQRVRQALKRSRFME